MSISDRSEVLTRAREGDSDASAELLELVYEKLRALASGYMNLERGDHTLQATALVHEAYIQLVDQAKTGWEDRDHFISVAACVMRRVLVDHARRRGMLKRAGDRKRVPLEDDMAVVGGPAIDLLGLEEALSRLQALDAHKARIVELRFFGGLTNAEVARVLEVSERKAEEDWYGARAWLRRELSKGGVSR